MSTRQLTRAIQYLLTQAQHIARKLTKRLVVWLFRNLLVLGRYPQLSKAGFILPTTVLLVLVLLLTVGSIGYRTYTRTVQTIGERQQRVIYNAATPTLDRAKSKIEYLFDSRKDPRFPSGIPSERWLLGMMLDYEGGTTVGTTVVPAHPTRTATYDPYILPGETRIDLDGDGRLDNAWTYPADTDGDGVNDSRAAYSIIYKTPATAAALLDTSDEAIRGTTTVPGRAARLEVRHGPLSNAGPQNPACATATASAATSDGVGRGWLPNSAVTSQLRKNFQVDVYVQPNELNRPVAALEFHQDRTVEQGNKWGAWFRNDLEIFPGPAFNWNGAMHSEGNIMVGNGSFRSYLISSEFSCLNTTKEASEVTTVVIPAPNAFTGEFIAGKINSDNSTNSDSAQFDLFKGFGAPPVVATLSSGTDSTPGTVVPSNFALDPVVLHTEGRSAARGTPPPTTATWAPVANSVNERLNQPEEEAPPYVDDSYRADNRYGPKPRYGGREGDPAIDIPATSRIGNVIPPTGNERLVGNTPAAGQDSSAVGLDGYWERRARNEGVRVIVGQRLELGDAAGWGGPLGSDLVRVSDSEPLRPWESCTTPTNRTGRCNEARQRRSLWDNLPAVQAAAIYHKDSAGGADVPAACLASTVHPGTAGTLDRSATFENLAYRFPASTFTPTRYDPTAGSTTPIISDFLRGRGTNGWEFSVPPVSEFANSATPTMRALRNLALLAGDPDGGAPSFTPVQNQIVHPYPALAMWGDFSLLRRVLYDRMLIDGGGGVAFADLSPADKSTLYASACTMGMLAYQLDYLADFNPENHPLIGKAYPTTSGGEQSSEPNLYFGGLRGAIRAIQAVNLNYSPLKTIPNLSTYAALNPEIYVRLLERWRDYMVTNGGTYTIPAPGVTISYTTDQMNQMILLAQMIISKEQVARDRQNGFLGSGSTPQSTLSYGDSVLGGRYVTAGVVPIVERSCREMNSGASINDPIKSLCSNRPFYPVLYDLFPAPEANTGSGSHRDADGLAGVGGRTYARDDVSTPEAQYFANNSGNAGKLFELVSTAAIALRPKSQSATWSLPVSELGAAPAGSTVELTPNNNRDNLIKVCLSDLIGPCLRNSAGTSTAGAFWQVGFKDSAFYNGREAMSVRAMDLHLDRLRQSPVGTDRWLPNSGIIYAYREDALSELSIVRPTQGDWATCDNENALRTDASCRMNTTVSAVLSKDPPLNDSNNITPKPVDYFADPDRRPNGFRLRQGKVLTRPLDTGRGLTFVSDNPVYIQGDFNLHQTSGGLRLEEFTTLLTYDGMGRYNNFYGRQLANLDNRFARPTTDQWRPSEVLTDAIHILSDNFCDGSIQDGFLTAGIDSAATFANANNLNVSSNRYGCQGNAERSSYLSGGRPKDASAGVLPELDATYRPRVKWTRTNLADTNVTANTVTTPPAPLFVEGDSPIFVSKQGNPWKDSGSFNATRDYTGSYYTLAENKSLTLAQPDTRINAIIISGLVPSRSQQSYGGLHNFPRFLESWKATQGGADIPLFVSGSLLQLSFSGQATGPFDQDAWEVGSAVSATESIQYYTPPLRRWGYDVGLQYAPAGPIAQRFVTVKSIRSEFYSEPPANDPYIQTLCRAIPGNTRPCT